jgi:hypothetical protein
VSVGIVVVRPVARSGCACRRCPDQWWIGAERRRPSGFEQFRRCPTT